MRRALVIVGKAPRPGASKTRLVPPLSPPEAAELSRAFLLDTVSLALGLGWERVCVVHPPADGSLLGALLPPGAECTAQEGAGLGAALRGGFEECFARGFERVVLIDSDSPTLPQRILEEACSALAQHDMVIGPSVDGGYYVLGLREPCSALFDEIPWSTSRVYEETLRRASELGLTAKSLEGWFDVDTADDLERLEKDLQRQAPEVAVHTRAALQRVRLQAAG